MKSALYIEQGITQIIITPENDLEKGVLGLINKQGVAQTIKVGNFSECAGGWIRQYPPVKSIYDDNSSIDSLMLVLKDIPRLNIK